MAIIKYLAQTTPTISYVNMKMVNVIIKKTTFTSWMHNGVILPQTYMTFILYNNISNIYF